jgi:hypothetical protein
MKRPIAFLSLAALAAALGTPSATFAQNVTIASFSASPTQVLDVVAPLFPAPVSSRDLVGVTSRYRTPSQVQPYGVTDQNNVRETIYKDPMHCPMTGLLTPGQMNAALQACSDNFYHVDHSG